MKHQVVSKRALLAQQNETPQVALILAIPGVKRPWFQLDTGTRLIVEENHCKCQTGQTMNLIPAGLISPFLF